MPCVCKRFACATNPRELQAMRFDDHTLAWCDAVNRSGVAYLTPAMLDGRWMVRVSIGAETTERKHVAELWKAMRAEAERGRGGS